jgi:hypothetical protein
MMWSYWSDRRGVGAAGRPGRWGRKVDGERQWDSLVRGLRRVGVGEHR